METISGSATMVAVTRQTSASASISTPTASVSTSASQSSSSALAGSQQESSRSSHSGPSTTAIALGASLGSSFVLLCIIIAYVGGRRGWFTKKTVESNDLGIHKGEEAGSYSSAESGGGSQRAELEAKDPQGGGGC